MSSVRFSVLKGVSAKVQSKIGDDSRTRGWAMGLNRNAVRVVYYVLHSGRLTICARRILRTKKQMQWLRVETTWR
jgi:hypothetical protein